MSKYYEIKSTKDNNGQCRTYIHEEGTLVKHEAVYISIFGVGNTHIGAVFNMIERMKYDKEKLDYLIKFAETYIAKVSNSDTLVFFDDVHPISVRLYNCMMRAGIKTLNEVSLMTKEELAPLRNFGRKTLEELEEIMDRYGFKFKEEK